MIYKSKKDKSTCHIQSFSVNLAGSDAASVGEASRAQPDEDQKPPILPAKKEPPTYPPGESAASSRDEELTLSDGLKAS